MIGDIRSHRAADNAPLSSHALVCLLMILSRVRFRFLMALFAAGFASPLHAQQATNAYCDSLKAELAAVDQSIATASNVNFAAQIKKAQREHDKTAAYAKSIGCSDLRLPLISKPAPAQCAKLEAQIGQLEQDIEALQIEAQRGGSDELKQQRLGLKTAIDTTCTPGANNGQAKAGVGSLIGEPSSGLQSSEMPDDPFARPELGLQNGFRTVCVRSCDGFFFPISQFGTNGRVATDIELCKASCPGAVVNLYLQPNDREIDGAVSAEGGTPYTALPTAYHYRTALDQSCSCRVPGKTWAETLADAERILSANGSTDAQISELKAQELSRPRDLKAAPKTKPKKGEPVPPPAPAQDVAVLQSAIPLGSDIVPMGAGELREIVAADGTKRKIRILRAPGAAAITE